MSRVHLVLLWHMHQPQYRDPSTGAYFLPWTRLHALKDYWGMVKLFEEFPGVRATFNIVPSLAVQLEEYARGDFREPWFELAFAPAASLDPSQRREILERAFQVNHENLMARWPRFVELYQWTQQAGRAAAAAQFGLRDWRDLQLLSQLAWMDEEYLEKDPIVSALAKKGMDFTEDDKRDLRAKQLALLASVLPEYRLASERGQIELSTTPFYHPILPLVCDTDIARVANPYTPLPQPPFRFPEDAREQLVRARSCHERLFGQPPAGMWPSEGSVSDKALEIAASLGFRWFASDEGVLGRTRGIGFGRDGAGYPENAEQLYSPWLWSHGGAQLTGLFRDHYLSDLIGFVYTRMSPQAAAEDLHRRLQLIGQRSTRPVTVALILDGENAWEYYRRNGREFLRGFYRRVESDPEIRAMTVSEAIASSEARPLQGIFPGSWINANFDIWIGHAEDVRAWELLHDARQVYAQDRERQQAGEAGAPPPEALQRSYESVLAAEGSDWCWWYGPENSSANDADFDALHRKHLTGIYTALGREAPDKLAQPIKRPSEMARKLLPSAFLQVRVDGRESSFFEWLGAGLYSPDRRSTAMHGRTFFLGDLHYGFSKERFYLRIDPLPGALAHLRDCEIRFTARTAGELRVTLRIRDGRVLPMAVEGAEGERPRLSESVEAALDQILEVSLGRELFVLQGQRSLHFNIALWRGGLPTDVLPAADFLEVPLGEDAFAWPLVNP
jgi:alpha-amylase/alpha-mannosidase (GH57 family)